jgi:hypothetical protein
MQHALPRQVANHSWWEQQRCWQLGRYRRVAVALLLLLLLGLVAGRQHLQGHGRAETRSVEPDTGQKLTRRLQDSITAVQLEPMWEA